MDKKTIKAIKKFEKNLRKDFHIDKIILFGSRAGEEYMEYSDIDLVIVSSDFKDFDMSKRISLMYNYWEGKESVDFFCYTPEEFEKLSKMISIVSEALKKGVVIK